MATRSESGHRLITTRPVAQGQEQEGQEAGKGQGGKEAEAEAAAAAAAAAGPGELLLRGWAGLQRGVGQAVAAVAAA